MSDNCIFCKIVSKEAKADVIYQDEQVTAFHDIHPVAPTHILIVPNRHIDSVAKMELEDEQIVGHIFSVARKLAEQEGIATSGYRLITNTGAHGGQSVFHMHVHLIGGKQMRFSMG
jgi:histidine triad (HIT) family protein